MRWEQDLTKDIKTGKGSYDDDDGATDIVREEEYTGTEEFTDCNRSTLEGMFSRVRDNCEGILEIGVCRNGSNSSTHIFLNNKKDETTFIGIDIDDKSFLNNSGKKIYTIQGDSSDIDGNITKIKDLGVGSLGFIFIDGWHSINQVLRDWEYTRLLAPNGIVGFHDTVGHPGPYHFVRNLNRDLWNVELHCLNDCGIGFAWRK